ncbi:MAG: flippase [Pyrinomonadaceae bacterium]|nr:flippase [Pyrinomonadaceae bacterium]
MSRISHPDYQNAGPKTSSLGDGDASETESTAHPAKAGASAESRIIVSNILSLGSGEIVARLIAFLGSAYLARRLEPAGFGMISFAAALFGYLALGVTAGFNDVGAREVARRPQDASSIAASVILLRTVLACFALAALGVLVWFLHKPPTLKLVIVLMGFSLFSLALDTSWAYKGLERSFPVSIALVVGQVLFVGLVLVFVKGPEDVAIVPVAQFVGEIAAALLLLVPILRTGKVRLDIREGLKLLRSSGLRTVTRILRTLIFTFDLVLIGFLLGERQVGLYSAPYRICFLFVAIAVTVHVSYMPALSRAFKQGPMAISDVARRSMGISAAIAAPMVVGGALLAAPLLQTFFGLEYVEGANAFRLLLLSIGLIFIHSTIYNLLLVSDLLRIEVGITAFAAAVNIVLVLMLVPRYGIVGAAFCTAVAEGIVLLMGLTITHRRGITFNVRYLVRPILAAGLMGIVLVLMGSGHSLLLYLPIGVMTYLLALIILRGVPEDAQPFLHNMTAFASGLRGRG